jgi:hypothetical protein
MNKFERIVFLSVATFGVYIVMLAVFLMDKLTNY